MTSLTAKTEKYQPLIDEKTVNSGAGAIIPYEPYRVPPNFQQAEEHLRATRVARPINKTSRIDAASHLPIENKGLSICCDIYDLNFLSPGYPMYFQFIKFCLLIGLATFLASGVHNLYANKQGSACLNSTAYYTDYYNNNDTTTTPSLPFFTYFQTTTTTTEPDGTTTTTTTPSNQSNNSQVTVVSDSNQGSTTTTTQTTPVDNTNQKPQADQRQTLSDDDDDINKKDDSTDADTDSDSHSDLQGEECPQNHINVLSVANISNDNAELEKEDIYNFFTIIVLLLIMQFIRKIQKQTAVICDEREITASDYTVRVTNLPRDFDQTVDIDAVIKDYFVENGLPGVRLNVQNVSVCYDVSERAVIEKKLAETIETRAKLKARKTKNELVSDSDITALKTEIQKYKDQLTAISKKFQEGVGVSKQFEGEAYVTFETQQELQLVLKHWNLGAFSRFRLWFSRTGPYKFRGKTLRVKEAAEPSDVVWENAGTSTAAKFTVRAITNLIIVGLLLIGFIMIFSIQKYKAGVLNDLRTSKVDIKTKGIMAAFQIKVITLGSTCVIVGLNIVLRIILQYLVSKGLYSTHTEFLTVYAKRLALAQFINTAVVSFVVSVLFKNISGEGGLIYSATFIILTDIAVQCGLSMFNIGYFSYLAKKSRTSKLKDPIMTQKQLNDIYRLPAFDFATKYAGYAKIMLTASFFAPLIPIVIPAAILGIGFEYWLDKHNLLRRSSRGKAAGTELPFEFIEFLEYCLVLFAVGNFLVNVYVIEFDPTEETLTFVGFAIGILNAILPMDQINEWLFPGKDEALTADKYSEIKYTFVEDYDRMNPATADLANEAFSREVTLRRQHGQV